MQTPGAVLYDGQGEKNTRKFVTQGYSHTQVLVLANLEEGVFDLSLLAGLGEKKQLRCRCWGSADLHPLRYSSYCLL